MSVLAKELKKEYELALEYTEAGFSHAYNAGELLAEVESMVGAEELSTWLNDNCSEIPMFAAKQFLSLFNGKEIQVRASKKKEVQET